MNHPLRTLLYEFFLEPPVQLVQRVFGLSCRKVTVAPKPVIPFEGGRKLPNPVLADEKRLSCVAIGKD